MKLVNGSASVLVLGYTEAENRLPAVEFREAAHECMYRELGRLAAQSYSEVNLSGMDPDKKTINVFPDTMAV